MPQPGGMTHVQTHEKKGCHSDRPILPGNLIHKKQRKMYWSHEKKNYNVIFQGTLYKTLRGMKVQTSGRICYILL